MADLTMLRVSPLAHVSDEMRNGSGPSVQLKECPFLTMLDVRAQTGSGTADRIGEVLGTQLPTACGETSSNGAVTALWLGPDEWLIVTTTANDSRLDDLREAIGGEFGSVVDVSANRTGLDLAGTHAREVLEKGCPVDLHPKSFAPGRAVATTLAQIPVIVWQVDDQAYRLLPRSSFADYLARWLLDAMDEYVETAEH